MNAHALVLDLWQTLIPLPDEIKRRAFLSAAHALHEDPDTLAPVWHGTRAQRETGPLTRYLYQLRRTLDRSWSDQMLNQVETTRRTIHGAMFEAPISGAAALLTAAKQAGWRVAVVSNGSSDIRAMFDGCVLAPSVDALVLSAEFGKMKPAPEIFRSAAERLHVATSSCIYAGDGHDQELEGASAVGMTAVLVDQGDGNSWSGGRVEDLVALRSHVGLG